MADDTNIGDDRALAAFELMLDTFGGCDTRWPADQRRGAAERLLQRGDHIGAAARRALAEARAIDRALATTPPFDAKRVAALASRIVAEARKSPVASNVVPLAPARRVAKPVVPARSGQWMAGAMLAASLLVGVVIGPGSLGLPALRDAVDAIGLGGYVDQLALAPVEDDGSAYEDVL